MNNQMPYGFMPQFNMPGNDIKPLIDRIDLLEKKVSKLEKKVNMLENTNPIPMPYNSFNTQEYPNNYMI